MPLTELACPTSVLGLFCRDTDMEAVVASMERRLPSEGLAPRRMRERFDLTRATYRLLDSRILEAAAKSLNQDVAGPLVEWLSAFHNLREAAAKTLRGEQEAVVELRKPTPFTSTQASDVVLRVADAEVARFSFRLELKLELGKTSVVVRNGAIDEIVCAVCCASASFTLESYPKPLWKPEPLSLPDVHVAVRPAFVVPLVEVPRPRESAEQPPRRATERPPVPGRRGTTRD